jgi:hypothetical protein
VPTSPPMGNPALLLAALHANGGHGSGFAYPASTSGFTSPIRRSSVSTS